MRHSALHTTLLLAALLCCCSLPFAAAQSTDCMFDRMSRLFRPSSIRAARQPPSGQAGAWQALAAAKDQAWTPLRVVVSDLDITHDGQFCAQNRDNQHIPNFKGGKVLCTADDVLTPTKRADLVELLHGAIRLHAERLLVKPHGGLIHVGVVSQQSVCTHFTIPAAHFTDGFADSDMVLYVSAAPIEENGQLTAWALACAVDDDGRPVVAAANFAPNLISVSRFAVRAAAHQIAHALGFDYRRMISRSMVQQVVKRDKQTVVVDSAVVKKAVQRHYGCDAVDGAELENGVEVGVGKENFYMKSHWERRNAKDELMAPIFGGRAPVAGYYTALTMSVFHALGFYRANFSRAEPMTWGAAAGCAFLDKKCVRGGKSDFPAMFCSEDLAARKQRCTSDRMGIGTCSLLTHLSAPLPDYFRYFGFENKGGCGKTLTDHCPIIAIEKSCYKALPQSEEKDENVLGINSWCLDGDNLKVMRNNNEVSIYGACAEVSCTDSTVGVRLSGDTAFRPCAPKQSIAARTAAGGKFISGTVRCPAFEEVCAIGPRGESHAAARPAADYADLQLVHVPKPPRSGGENGFNHQHGGTRVGRPESNETALLDAEGSYGANGANGDVRTKDGCLLPVLVAPRVLALSAFVTLLPLIAV